MKNKNNPIQLQEEDIMVRQQAFEWTKELFRYAKEDEAAAENFFHKLVLHDSVYKEYIYYMNHGQFLGECNVCGMTVIDIMIWQIDHFKANMDRGMYDLESNPDKMLLNAFEIMLEMHKNPQPYLSRFMQETGTDYPGKF